MAIRVGLLREVVVMAFDTVRTNKMRSGLTVLGVVIGITSIVGMTAMIRGFDQSLRDMIGAIGPNTIFVQRFGVTSFANGAEFQRAAEAAEPDASPTRARSRSRATTLQYVDIELGAGAGPSTQRRVFYRDLKTKNLIVLRHRPSTSPKARGFRCSPAGSSTAPRCSTGKNVVVLGNTAVQAAVRADRHRSDRQDRCASAASASRSSASSTSGRRPAASTSARTTSSSSRTRPISAIFGLRAVRVGRDAARSCTIQISRAAARRRARRRTRMADVERVMRIRHGLKLDEPNDFDLLHPGRVPEAVGPDQPGDVLRAGRDLVDRADGRRHRRDGDHVDLGDRADARDRRAQGARRAARGDPVPVPDGGGVPHLARRRARHRCSAARIGWAVHLVSGFPISLPWWSFAHRPRLLGVGRHLLRHVSRVQGLAPRSDRSAALRIDATGARTPRPPRTCARDVSAVACVCIAMPTSLAALRCTANMMRRWTTSFALGEPIYEGLRRRQHPKCRPRRSQRIRQDPARLGHPRRRRHGQPLRQGRRRHDRHRFRRRRDRPQAHAVGQPRLRRVEQAARST